MDRKAKPTVGVEGDTSRSQSQLMDASNHIKQTEHRTSNIELYSPPKIVLRIELRENNRKGKH